jgi:hypothetical protein
MMNEGTAGLPDDVYWAAVETERLPEVVRAKMALYRRELDTRGWLDLWRRSWQAYYGLDDVGLRKQSAGVTFSGAAFENVDVEINQYRSILDAMIAMASPERPAFMAKALSDDGETLKEAPNATGLVEAHWRKEEMEGKTGRDDARALILAESFLHEQWNPRDGKRVKADPGMPADEEGFALDEFGAQIREGKLCPESLMPTQVIHDRNRSDDELEWAIVVRRRDCFQLAAEYPQFRDDILAQRKQPRWPIKLWEEERAAVPDGDDDVDEIHVYVRPSAAVPKGRWALICGERVLRDKPGVLPNAIPVVPLIPEMQLDSGEGHSPVWDLLVLQELYNAAWGSLATRADNGAVNNVLVEENSDITNTDLQGGRRVLRYKGNPNDREGGRPVPLDLLQLPAQLVEYPKTIEEVMQTLRGVNSTVRGNPDPNIKSGSFAALMSASATKFNGVYQGACQRHRERVASIVVDLTKAQAKNAQRVEMKGMGSARYVRNVMPTEIEDVDNIVIEPVSAAIANPAGRIEMAKDMLATVKNLQPEQFVEVYTTGRLEPLYKSTKAKLDAVYVENDMLTRGKRPQVHVSQDPGCHIREHSALLTPEVLGTPIAKVIEDHITEHYVLAFGDGAPANPGTPPLLAQLYGWTIMPEAPAPPTEAPSKEGAKEKAKTTATERARPMGGEPSSDMPLMPENPATGERAPAT